MTMPKTNPVPLLDLGTEILVIVDDGEEWSLATDDPQYELRQQDWDKFNPAECRPADFRMLMNQLQQSA